LSYRSVRDGTVIPVTESKAALIATLPHVTASGPVYRVSFATMRQTYLDVLGIDGDDFREIFRPSFASGSPYSGESGK
jgi:hypothetical protein